MTIWLYVFLAIISIMLLLILLSLLFLVFKQQNGIIDYDRIAVAITSGALSDFPDGNPSDAILTTYVRARYYDICQMSGLPEQNANLVIDKVTKLMGKRNPTNKTEFSFYD